MNVSETCSCGASFAAEGDGVVRLLREWRVNHTCNDKPDQSDGVITSSGAQVEQAPIGFAPPWLPGRRDHALEDDE